MIAKPFIFFIICFTALKIFAVYLTTFGLFGDEAQYWLWSKDLSFGYFSKPPLLSWFIALVTFLFGDGFFVLKIELCEKGSKFLMSSSALIRKESHSL